jgi:hypothetical protein
MRTQPEPMATPGAAAAAGAAERPARKGRDTAAAVVRRVGRRRVVARRDRPCGECSTGPKRQGSGFVAAGGAEISG